MNAGLRRAAAMSIGLALLYASTALSQPLAQPAAASDTQPATAPEFSVAQVDQMVAPVALYPDPLLSKVLMAATYPVEVVEADRWRQDPSNSSLSGDALASALDGETWDPSVKALAAYPQILKMLDGDLDWTEALGEAFIAEPDVVMDEIQKLRRQAQADGKLGSNSKETVTVEDGEVDIQPADGSEVYAPSYDPSVVFVPWPYPDFPPYYFPGYFDDCVVADFGDCWIVWPIFVPYWGWDHWDWRHHHIDVDRDRFGHPGHGRPPAGEGAWQHEPSHRRGAPYQSPQTAAQFPAATAPADKERAARGFPSGSSSQAPSSQAPMPTHAPATVESYGQGGAVRAEAQRGASSRMSTPGYTPRGGGAPSGGHVSGGGRGGVGGGSHR